MVDEAHAKAFESKRALALSCRDCDCWLSQSRSTAVQQGDERRKHDRGGSLAKDKPRRVVRDEDDQASAATRDHRTIVVYG